MTPKIFRNIIIVCVAAFLMAALSIALCANYLFTYKPTTDSDDERTFVVTDKNGETQIIRPGQIEGSYNFLVLGHDRAALLTDVIMLVNYNVNNKSVTITQFPRDTYISLDVPIHKLNATFATYYNQEVAEGKSEEDARLAALQRFEKVFEDSFGITIYKSAIMNLEGFVNIVDALGGVEVNVPTDMTYVDEAQNLTINLRAGLQRLNGAQAEGLVRFRANYIQADIGRENAQKIFISSLLKELKKSIDLSNLGKLTEIATSLIENLTTDMTVSDLVYFAKPLIADVDLSNVRLYTAPCNGATSETGYSYIVLQKDRLMEVITENYNTTDVSPAIMKQNFDRDYYFNDIHSSELSKWYNYTGEPTIGYKFNAQEIIDDSIDIPEY